MSDSPLDFDLKIMPDWLKEPAGKNPYADFEGEPDRPPRRDFDRGPGRPGGGRPGFGRPGGAGPGRPGGGSRDSRDSRPGGGNRGPSRPPQARQGPPLQEIKIPQRSPDAPPRPVLPSQSGQQPRPDRQRPDRENRGPRQGGGQPRGEGGQRNRDQQERRQPQQPRPERIEIPLHVDIIPEPDSVSALAQQIRQSHRAYPLYAMGRMFLTKPERHRVRITSNAPAHPLYQIGEDGPVSLNRNAIEREAFRTSKSKYYTEETVQTDAPKGNYTNVARCRFSGVLLGPTNHHSYQLALRKLYDGRFSRRMDFQDFLRQIEVISDPAVIEEWKKQVSSTTVFRTTQEAEPKEFKTQQEVEAHFRETYLPTLIRSGRSMEMNGIASREVVDNELRTAIRAAWEKERGFPAQIVGAARSRFIDAGLQIWRHRKRIFYISPFRPLRFVAAGRTVSDHVADLLNIIESSPKCTRTDIAARLIKPHEGDPELAAKLKGAIVSDLHWLIQSGHVIEFHDGTFDLPLLPKELAKEAQGQEGAEAEESAGAEKSETSTEAEALGPCTSDEAPANDCPVSESPAADEPAGETEDVATLAVPHAEMLAEAPVAEAAADAEPAVESTGALVEPEPAAALPAVAEPEAAPATLGE